MKKKKMLFCSSAIAFLMAFASIGSISLAKTASANATSSDDIDIVLSPRSGQGANFSVQSTYSAVNVKYNGGTTNVRSMLYANCTKAGDEYIDISSFAANGRLEYLFYDGATNEHVQPFLVDKDGRTYTFGTTDDTSIAGSAYTEATLDVSNPANNTAPSGWAMNNNTQYTLNYHGFPINRSAHGASASDFIYYHLNLASKKFKSGYTEWASGSGFSPATTGDFDYSNVKLAGFWMNKQNGEETSANWDIRLLEVSVRNTNTGERKVLFDASKAVVTTSNTTLWNDRVDTNGNSYVFLWNNSAIASNVTVEIKNDFTAKTTSQSRPLSTLNNGEITITGSKGDAWLWAFAKNYDRFAAMDLTGYDGTIWHINNTTGAELYFDWYLINNGNQILNKMWLFADDGDDLDIVNPVTSSIPAGFKGWVYSLFEQNPTLQASLASCTNTTRFVLKVTDALIGKTFTVDTFKFVKNGVELKNAAVAAKQNKQNLADFASEKTYTSLKLGYDKEVSEVEPYDTTYTIANDEGKNDLGIRFGACIPASLKQKLDAQGTEVKYGVAYKVGEALEYTKVETEGALVDELNSDTPIEETLAEAVTNEDYFQFGITIDGIPLTSIDVEIEAVAYVEIDEVVTMMKTTAKYCVRSLAEYYVTNLSEDPAVAPHLGILNYLISYEAE